MNAKSVSTTKKLPQVKSLPLQAHGLACNICGGTNFKPGPLGRISITGLPPVCVECGSLERHRVFRAIFNQFRSTDFKSLSCLMFSMDRSVATGWFRSFRYSVYGTDNSLDLQDIALSDGAFDVVICNHVLEHVPRYEVALKEIVRVLSRRGFAFISFPNPHYRQETSDWGHPKEHGHYRVFGSDIEAKLPVLLPGVGILRVVAKDPVTEIEDRAYIVSKNSEFLDGLTEKGVRCRFLRA
jgi:SAM-dependent methyltransferase